MSEKPKISDEKIRKAMANAEASLRMEGMQTTPELDWARWAVLKGEMTDKEYIEVVYEHVMGKKLQRDVNGNGRAE